MSDGVDSFHIRPRVMRSTVVLTAAVVATVVAPANAEKLKLRCENPTAQFSRSTLYIDEVNGRITQIWDADGYEETSPAKFKDGVWSWVVVTDAAAGEPGIVNEMSLDRRTGVVSNAIQGQGAVLTPNGEVCF